MSHPNAHLFAELAEMAKTDDEAIDKVQFLSGEKRWVRWNEFRSHELFHPNMQWRFRPVTVTVEAWAVVVGNCFESLHFEQQGAYEYAKIRRSNETVRIIKLTPEDQQ